MKEELLQTNLQIKYEPQNNVEYGYTYGQLTSKIPLYNGQSFCRQDGHRKEV